MAGWHKSREALFADWAVYFGTTCAIVYLLVRHCLLVKRKLKGDALGCGECTKATVACLCKKEAAKKQRPSRRLRKGNVVHMKLIFHCTFATMGFYVLLGVNVFISNLTIVGWLPFVYCKYSVAISGLLILFARSCMYVVFVARLHIVFDDSAFGYNKHFIYSLYTAICFYTMIVMVVLSIFVRAERTEFHANGSKVHWCVNVMPFFVYAIVVCFDTIFNVLLVVLFVSALMKMVKKWRAVHNNSSDARMRSDSNTNDHSVNKDLYFVALKYTVITTVAVASTFTAWFFYSVSDWASLVAMDCVVNSASLLLMTGKWQPAYVLICTPLLNCIAHTCVPSAFVEAGLVEMLARIRGGSVSSGRSKPARTELSAVSTSVTGMGEPMSVRVTI